MNAQASVENVMLMMLILTISTVVVGRWLQIDDKTYVIGAAREGAITEIEKMDSNKFFVRKIDGEIIKCSASTNQENVLINFDIHPAPSVPNRAILTAGIQNRIKTVTGRDTQNTRVFFNEPGLLYTTTC